MMYNGPPIPLNYRNDCLVPFHVGHLWPLVQVMHSWKWGLPDEWRPSAFERIMTLAASPNTSFYSVEAGGEWGGAIYITQITPGHSAWIHGYCQDSKNVFCAVAAVRTLTDVSFRELDLDVIYTEHCRENRSITAVSRRAGYTIRGHMPLAKKYKGKLYDSTVLALTREEWLALEGR